MTKTRSRRRKHPISPSLSRNPRVLNALEVLDCQVEIKRTYVEYLEGYIHYRTDIPAGWLLKVVSPDITRREQLLYSINIIKACAVNQDGTPFFTEEQVNSLSPDKIAVIINAILDPKEYEGGEGGSDDDNIKAEAVTKKAPKRQTTAVLN